MQDVAGAIVEYVMWKRHEQDDHHDLGLRIDGMWLKHAQYACVVELCAEVERGEAFTERQEEAANVNLHEDFGLTSPMSQKLLADSDMCGSCEEGGSTSSTAAPSSARPARDDLRSACSLLERTQLLQCHIQRRMEDLALNSLHVTQKSRSGVTAEGGADALERSLRDFCASKACEWAPHLEALLDDSTLDAAHAAISELRLDMETEFEALLAAKTANAEIMVELNELLDEQRRRAWACARTVIDRLRSVSTGAPWRNCLLALAELACCSQDDQEEICILGGLDAVTHLLSEHCTEEVEDEFELVIAVAYAMRHLSKDMLEATCSSELDELLNRLEGHLVAKMRLRFEWAVYDNMGQALDNLAAGMVAEDAVATAKRKVEQLPSATMANMWTTWCGTSERDSLHCALIFDGCLAKVERCVTDFVHEMVKTGMAMLDRLLHDEAGRTEQLVRARQPEIMAELTGLSEEVAGDLADLKRISVHVLGECQERITMLDRTTTVSEDLEQASQACGQPSKKRSSKSGWKKIAGRGRKAMSSSLKAAAGGVGIKSHKSSSKGK